MDMFMQSLTLTRKIEIMKTYLLFAGYNYYPNGGIEDYQGDFDSIDAAYKWMLKSSKTFDWWQIVQSNDMSVCDRGNK